VFCITHLIDVPKIYESKVCDILELIDSVGQTLSVFFCVLCLALSSHILTEWRNVKEVTLIMKDDSYNG
jgi:hypothetical protein